MVTTFRRVPVVHFLVRAAAFGSVHFRARSDRKVLEHVLLIKCSLITAKSSIEKC